MELALFVLFWICLAGIVGLGSTLVIVVVWPELERARPNTQVAIVSAIVSSAIVWGIGVFGLFGILSTKLILSFIDNGVSTTGVELAYMIGAWMATGGIVSCILLFIFFVIIERFISWGKAAEAVLDTTFGVFGVMALALCVGIGTLGVTGIVDLCI